MPQKKDKPYSGMKKPPVSLLFSKSKQEISTSKNKIPLEQIKLAESQPRRYFDPLKLENLAKSIQEHGVLEPLLVRRVGNSYELIAGERRVRASEIAGLTEVPVVVLDLDECTVAQVRLIENLQREDLNPLEETEGILELLALRLRTSSVEIAKSLQRMEQGSRGEASHNVMGSEKLDVVEEVFSSLGTMSWKSFVKNRLPLLNLPEDLLAILRAGKLEYTKVKAISKIKDSETRKDILKVAQANNLSLNQIKSKIKELTTIEETSSPLKEQVNTTFRRLKNSKALNDPKKMTKIEKLLEQLDKLLD